MAKIRTLTLMTAALISLGSSAAWAQAPQTHSQLIPQPYTQQLNNPNGPNLSPQTLHPPVVGAPSPYASPNSNLVPLPAPQLTQPQTGTTIQH